MVWKPDVCIHSEKCFHGLPKVFNPKQRPWVDMQAAETDTIAQQVTHCPSGALTYYKNGSKEDLSTENTTVQTIIEVMSNGPLMVYGNVTVKRKDGTEEKKNKVTALCRCGASANKPYCDGSHVRIAFEDK